MAGRPAGTPKTGGRQKGSVNQATLYASVSNVKTPAAAMSLLADMTAGERARVQPKEILLRIMRVAAEAGNLPVAMAAAEKAAPYCHAKLSNMELNATVRRAASDFTDAELLALAGRSKPSQDLLEDETGAYAP